MASYGVSRGRSKNSPQSIERRGHAICIHLNKRQQMIQVYLSEKNTVLFTYRFDLGTISACPGISLT